MNAIEMRRALGSGRRVYGTLIVSPSPRWPDVVTGLGLDFVFLDTEHIALDRAQLSWMCQTYRALDLTPLVRVSSPDPYLACMALDGGAAGVVVPYVETVEQVHVMRGAVRFRPLKGERLAAVLGNPRALEDPLSNYLEARNGDSILVINIESVPAVHRLDELVSVPGVDAVLIGPHDLSCSLGIPEQYDNPRFEETVLAIIRRSRARGVAAGIHWWGDPARLVTWARAGLNLIIYSADILALRTGISAALTSVRLPLGDSAGSLQPSVFKAEGKEPRPV